MDMRSSNRTFWQNDEKVVKQPTNIDYSQLSEKLAKQDDYRKVSNQNVIKDFRKTATQGTTHFMYEDPNSSFTEDNEGLGDIEKSSIIPVPGMAISYENDEHDWKPPTSDWIAPQGPQWGPMTQN